MCTWLIKKLYTCKCNWIGCILQKCFTLLNGSGGIQTWNHLLLCKHFFLVTATLAVCTTAFKLMYLSFQKAGVCISKRQKLFVEENTEWGPTYCDQQEEGGPWRYDKRNTSFLEWAFSKSMAECDVFAEMEVECLPCMSVWLSHKVPHF